jgi:predicted HicB family RNase H-like nuclease
MVKPKKFHRGITVRFTIDDYENLVLNAKLKKISIAAYIRELCAQKKSPVSE